MDTIYSKTTETIDKLFLELSQFTQARTKDELLYDELIYAVMRKFPGETRHQTALRYIREAEIGKIQDPCKISPGEVGKSGVVG